uniref:Uncharacterized protein n=1 Tax=Meloidogyne enterolobii TaxID=390850 RepID=A0A6V7WMZ6_MELEN|nr:unnamed protein product [Meloidogyne enterolobii]
MPCQGRKKGSVKIKNKWKEIDSEYKCCKNNCINTNNPIGNCIKGNGVVNIINDEIIKYINCLGWIGYDKCPYIYAENSFENPENSLNYSLYYFEVKCKLERELNSCWTYMNIGFKNCSTNKHIGYTFNNKFATICNENCESFQSFELENISWNNDDIFGCGLIYPPTNKMTYKFPYVFFTQNGIQIGKGILLKEISDIYKPYAWLRCCSIETNFGNNLESKPFKYRISKHSILKEFY